MLVYIVEISYYIFVNQSQLNSIHLHFSKQKWVPHKVAKKISLNL